MPQENRPRTRPRTLRSPAASNGASALSRLALVGERVWEALLWPFLVVAVFLILSLFDLWSVMPPLLHRGLLIAFGIALLVSLLPLIRFPMPTRAEALRRLERNAEIKHRPASSYEDKLGTTSRGDTALLWAAHRERLAKLVAKLKPSWPVPRTDRKDPYAIRSALLLVLVVAALAAGPDRWGRIASAFTPAANTATALLRLDAWVTPPVYTGIAPIVLADGSEPVGAGAETFRALSVPERSQLLVRVFSPRGETVSLETQPDDGTEPKLITPRSTGSQGLMEFNMALTSPGAADVKVGGNTVAKWRFDLIKDSVPQIGLMANPTTTPRGALRLSFRATDDHGVSSAEARFALADTEAAKAPVPELEGGKGQGRQASVQSLARSAADAAATAEGQCEAGGGQGIAGPDRPSLGRPEGAHDTRRPRPGRSDRPERALRIHPARAEFHQASRQGRGRAAQEARARAGFCEQGRHGARCADHRR